MTTGTASGHLPEDLAGVIRAGQERLHAEVNADAKPAPGVIVRDRGPVHLAVNDTNHRCAVRETVADKMRAVPFSSLRASFRVDSWVRMVPSRGSVTVVPEQRITPVPNRNESLHFPRFLAFGNPSRLPFRRPFFDLMKSHSARSRSRNASW